MSPNPCVISSLLRLDSPARRIYPDIPGTHWCLDTMWCVAMVTVKESLRWALHQKVWNRVQVSGSMAECAIVQHLSQVYYRSMRKASPELIILGPASKSPTRTGMGFQIRGCQPNQELLGCSRENLKDFNHLRSSRCLGIVSLVSISGPRYKTQTPNHGQAFLFCSSEFRYLICRRHAYGI
jgi:hypothetical protein